MRINRALLAAPALGVALLLVGPSAAEACHKNPCAPTVKHCTMRTPKVKHCGFKMPKLKMPKLGCHKKTAACPPVVYQQPSSPTYYGTPAYPSGQGYPTPQGPGYGMMPSPPAKGYGAPGFGMPSNPAPQMPGVGYPAAY